MPHAARTPNAVSHAVAAQIRAERAAAGLTREQVYGQAGMSRSTYSRIEKGAVVVDAVQLAAIAAVLGLPAWEIWRRAEERVRQVELAGLTPVERAALEERIRAHEQGDGRRTQV